MAQRCSQGSFVLWSTRTMPVHLTRQAPDLLLDMGTPPAAYPAPFPSFPTRNIPLPLPLPKSWATTSAELSAVSALQAVPLLVLVGGVSVVLLCSVLRRMTAVLLKGIIAMADAIAVAAAACGAAGTLLLAYVEPEAGAKWVAAGAGVEKFAGENGPELEDGVCGAVSQPSRLGQHPPPHPHLHPHPRPPHAHVDASQRIDAQRNPNNVPQSSGQHPRRRQQQQQIQQRRASCVVLTRM